MSEPTRVSHYGVHEGDHGIKFLVQPGEVKNFIGWEDAQPFTGLGSKKCPHAIDTYQGKVSKETWAKFAPLLKDSLVEDLLPLPKVGKIPAYFVTSRKVQDAIDLLAQLSSPSTSPVVDISTTTAVKVIAQLKLTNITPLVLTHIEGRYHSVVSHILAEAPYSPRKLVLVYTDDYMIFPASVVKRETDLESGLDFSEAEMRALGLEVIRKYCRGESICNNIV